MQIVASKLFCSMIKLFSSYSMGLFFSLVGLMMLEGSLARSKRPFANLLSLLIFAVLLKGFYPRNVIKYAWKSVPLQS